jgi:beta-glucosidase
LTAYSSEAWRDRSLSPDARADAIVRAMTLDEKIHLLHGPLGFAYAGRPTPAGARGGAGFIAALPRLGIPALQLNDGPLGVRNIVGGPDGRATAFPSAQALAAGFDPELAFESGRIMGRETRDRGFNVLLAGGVGVERDAWNGRNFEYLGEDPVLAGRIVTAQVRGIQSQGVVSTIKHLVANTQETDRHYVDMVADERSLREIDMLPFEMAVKESGVGSVMCAYNKVNGIYACENPHLLNDILKSEWGFKGWVISDWGATHSTVQAANAGLDQEFYEERYFASALKTAVEKGEVSEARIDDMARRILRSLAATGALDRTESVQPVDAAAGLAVAQRVAESGIVLPSEPRRAAAASSRSAQEDRGDRPPRRRGRAGGRRLILRRIDRRRHGGRHAARHRGRAGPVLQHRLASLVAVEGDRGGGAVGESGVRIRGRRCSGGQPCRFVRRGNRVRVAESYGRPGPSKPFAAGRPG